VLKVARGSAPTEVVATGRIGAEVNRAFFEIRAVNPNLVTTPIGRRDVRALPGPVVACKYTYMNCIVHLNARITLNCTTSCGQCQKHSSISGDMTARLHSVLSVLDIQIVVCSSCSLHVLIHILHYKRYTHA
jgi:hypothetical protein